MRHFVPAFTIALGVTAPAAAQEAEALEGSERPPQTSLLGEDESAGNRVTVDLGATLVSEYVSRGIAFAEEASLQPHATVSLSLPEITGGAITDASVFAGIWNSVKLGTVPPGDAGQLTRFYESDLYAGAALELYERWNVSATYYRYESLGKSFDGYNDLELIVGFDDAGLWENVVPLDDFSLSPAVRLVQEAGRPGRVDALYIQPSLSPSFDLGGNENPVRVTIPLVAGFSDEYYDSVSGGTESFGFFRTGATVSGTPFPDGAPALTVSGGFDLWILNDDVVNGLGSSKLVGRIGASWSF